MTCDDLLAAQTHDNVSAFLRVIREGESSQSNDAYRMLFGGKLFDSFEDHPRVRTYEKNDEFIRNGKKDFTTAAGAYQFTASTWDPIAKRFGLKDFGPINQDCAAVALIAEVRALDLVKEGRIREAIARCSSRWASLPGANTPQPQQQLAHALAVYKAHGGRTEQPAVRPVVGAAAPTVP